MHPVLQFPSPAAPAFALRESLDVNGKGVISKWLGWHQGARAKLRVRIKHLRRVPRAEWNKSQFRYLEDGLYEIKWSFGNKEFRVAGFDHLLDSNAYFVLLIGFTHKQGVSNPHDWLNTAKRRKGEVENGERRTGNFEP